MGNLLPWITTSSSCPLPPLLLLRASCFLLLASLPPRLLTPPLEISASRKCLPLSPVRQINQIVARSVACAGLIYTSKQRRRERERERGEVRTLVGCVHKPQVYILSLFLSLSRYSVQRDADTPPRSHLPRYVRGLESTVTAQPRNSICLERRIELCSSCDPGNWTLSLAAARPQPPGIGGARSARLKLISAFCQRASLCADLGANEAILLQSFSSQTSSLCQPVANDDPLLFADGVNGNRNGGNVDDGGEKVAIIREDSNSGLERPSSIRFSIKYVSKVFRKL